MSQCGKCPAKIVFCKTPSGKWMPIDEKPNPDGNLFFAGKDSDGRQLVEVVDLFTPAKAVRYMPHWATCPAAKVST